MSVRKDKWAGESKVGQDQLTLSSKGDMQTHDQLPDPAISSLLRCPFPGRGIVPAAVGAVKLGDLRHEGIIRIRICEQGADRKENLGDSQGWAPLIFEDVQTDASVGVDVAVIDTRREINFGRLEWVISRKVDVQVVDAASIRRVLWDLR